MCVNSKFLSFHEERHLERTFIEWKWVADSMCNNLKNVVNNAQCQPKEEDDDEDVASDEALGTKKLINMYQCSHTK